MTDLEERLRIVVTHGDPAQAAHAEDLLTTLSSDPHDTSAIHAAELLIDAYLNDPYLTR